MSNKYIVKVDISGKQEYIYSSNRLKEIIGASEIIRFVTEDLGKMILEYKMGLSDEVFGGEKGNVLYNKGGNSAFIFDEEKEAKEFNNIFSRIVMKNFSGLQLLLAIEKDVDIENSPIWSFYQRLEQKLTKKKESRRSIIQRVSFGMTKKCPNTGKPAGYEIYSNKNDTSNRKELVSKETFDKRMFFDFVYGYQKEAKKFDLNNIIETNEKNYDEIKSKVKRNFNELKNELDFRRIKYDRDKDSVHEYIYHHEHEKIGGKRNSGSYMAIACMDGNKMGVKVDAFKKPYEERFEKCKDKDERLYVNMDYIKAYEEFTREIDEAYKTSFFETLEYLKNKLRMLNKEDKEKLGLSGKMMPIRHIILAGDDISFVANAKIAIEASKIFIEKVYEKKGEYIRKPLTVSGGISMVSTKYPFSRAQKAAGKREVNAKSIIEQNSQELRKRLEDLNCESNLIEDIIKTYDIPTLDWNIIRGEGYDIEKNDRNPYMISNSNLDELHEKLSVLENKIDIDELLELVGISSMDRLDVMLELYKKLFEMDKDEDKSFKSKLVNFFRKSNISEDELELFIHKYQLDKRINTFRVKDQDGKEQLIGMDILKKKELFRDAIELMNMYVPLENK